MAKSKEFKTRPAGKNEKLNITYTEFAANQERTEIKIGEGKEFDNDTLLVMLGFEKDSNGDLKLRTSDHYCELAENGELIRKSKDGKEIITDEKKEQEEVEIG